MTTHPDLAVVTDGLTKRFGDFTAVDHIDLEVRAGTVVSLLGPNGAGKTTTVRMLATLTAPTSGTATVLGHDVAREGDAVRSRISLTGQFAALEDNLTARENLVLMARLRGYGRAAAHRVTDGLVDRFDIGEFRDKLVKDVSGGQRRRVDLAASLVVPPQLLVLDEPTTGLDPRSRQVVWSTINDLVAQGVTLLLTTQYLDEADDVARLATALSPTFELTVAPTGRMLSIPAPEEAADLARVATAVRATGIAVDEVALRRPTLDDAFLALTGQSPTDPTTEPDGSDRPLELAS